jgi:ferrochelatase
MHYDAILLISFGGPERPEDVMPFLENVVRGRNVPRERLLKVAEHYHHFDGRSPINDHCRELLKALQEQVSLPVYWGNRNWHPLLPDTLRQMAELGIKRALAIATSAYSSYSGCRQYIEDIERARAAAGPRAPEVDKLPPFGAHPLFVEANLDRLKAVLEGMPPERRAAARLVFTAHSIPVSMAASSKYEEQIRAVACQVAAKAGFTGWDLAWQSRSGPPSVPWLEPDILDHLRNVAAQGVREVVLAPIGFLSDHMEVLYDLDVEAAQLCSELGLNCARAATAGTHPAVIRLFREMIETSQAVAEPIGCAPGCCPPPASRPIRT